jgi:sulfate adenylyltransferase large subunit/phosphoadenylyl-sulfate reductase (thioredoxin)
MNMHATNDSAEPRQTRDRPLLRVVFVGHVDHGKSTLIGRLLHETGSLPDGKLANLTAVSERRGVPFEWSFVLDALQTERDQGITLDTSQVRLRTEARDIVLIDAPGHAELLRNMVTGAAQADAALLLIDATEGVRDQTRRHIHLLHLLGVPQLAVVVNKMDRIGFDQTIFAAIKAEITEELSRLGSSAVAILPIAARHGDGVAEYTPALAWHNGPTVLQVLDGFTPAKPPAALPLRFPVQAVYKFDDRRIVAGRVESGQLVVGDDVTIWPKGTRSRIRSIETWPASSDGQLPRTAVAGQSIGLTLDQQVFVERGDLIAALDQPAKPVRRLRARVFWLHHEPLRAGETLGVRIGMAEQRGKIAAIDNVIDPGELAKAAPSELARNHIGEIEIELAHPVGADLYVENPRTGRLVLDVDGRIAGGGLILSLGADTDRGRDKEAQDIVADGGSLIALAARLNDSLAPLHPRERLERFCREVAGKVVFTTSFGQEDQAILHMLQERALDLDVVTIDTGRLFPETYALWAETERKYGRRIRAVYPRQESVEAFVETYGIDGFYDSPDARLACCHARKVEPLSRALAGASGWIVGLRADQSDHRQETKVVSIDERGLLKFSPLFDWSRQDVQSFAKDNEVPLNPLHDRGFVSIGCAPCTRAIAPGEPERAGRWWWEEDAKRECGLHSRPGAGDMVERAPIAAADTAIKGGNSSGA